MFYALPKLHKKVYPPPGRPIVSGIRGPTERIGTFVDDALRPHVTSLPSYLRDTLQLLQNLDDLSVPPETILVTLDIEALYSSIPHRKGLQIIGKFLSEQGSTAVPLNDFTLELLEHNLF